MASFDDVHGNVLAFILTGLANRLFWKVAGRCNLVCRKWAKCQRCVEPQWEKICVDFSILARTLYDAQNANPRDGRGVTWQTLCQKFLDCEEKQRKRRDAHATSRDGVNEKNFDRKDHCIAIEIRLDYETPLCGAIAGFQEHHFWQGGLVRYDFPKEY